MGSAGSTIVYNSDLQASIGTIQDQLNGIELVEVSDVDADGTLSNHSIVLADASRGNITLTLPETSSNTNKILRIKKVDSSSNYVIVTPYNSETIDGESSVQITTQWTALTLVCNGINWFII